MKSALCVCILFIGVCYAVPIDNKDLTKYENFDIDRVINNERVLTNYIKCLMDEGSCTNEGRDLKKNIPDALAGGCDNCNEKQKNMTEKVIRHLVTKRPKDWERLSKKYDPQGLYRHKYDYLLEKVKKGESIELKDLKSNPKEQTPVKPKETPKKDAKIETKKEVKEPAKATKT